MKTVYIIGALKNWAVVDLANELQEAGFDAFADWITPGPEADKFLLKYAKRRGWSYKQALNSHAARHVFEFDKSHLEPADIVVMVMPAGKSAHMEFGWHVRSGKPGYILFDKEPKRFDVMYRFATDIFFSKKGLLAALKNQKESVVREFTDYVNFTGFERANYLRLRARPKNKLKLKKGRK